MASIEWCKALVAFAFVPLRSTSSTWERLHDADGGRRIIFPLRVNKGLEGGGASQDNMLSLPGQAISRALMTTVLGDDYRSSSTTIRPRSRWQKNHLAHGTVTARLDASPFVKSLSRC
jgi:hypothetical protein